jgi:hypothetical protein
MDVGWVYFVRCRETELIKIGYTGGSIADRFSKLKSDSGSELVMLGMIEGSRQTERKLHHRFRAHRAHGEWFRRNPDLEVFIINNVKSIPRLNDWKAQREIREFVKLQKELGFTTEQFCEDILNGSIPLPPYGK